MEVTSGETFRLSGRFDGRSTDVVREALYAYIDRCPEDVVVDVSGVESADVTAVRLLAVASRRTERSGRRLVLRGCCPAVRRLLVVSRLRRLMQLERETA